MRILNYTFIISATALLWCCTCNNAVENTGNKDMCNNAIDTSNIDFSSDPEIDFYRFANGNWIINNPVPDEFSVYGSFHKLGEDNIVKLKELFDSLADITGTASVPAVQKISGFYASGLDTATTEKENIMPLKAYFDEINSISTINELFVVIAKLHTIESSALFNLYSAQDEKNSSMVIAQFAQGGLGLPDRDYYSDETEFSVKIRNEYITYIDNLLNHWRNAGFQISPEAPAEIMKIETQLAKASMTRLELRDPVKLYNKMTIKELTLLAPAIPWAEYFNTVGLPDIKSLNVNQPDFFKEINYMLKSISLPEWKSYLVFHLTNSFAPYLNSGIEELHFGFYGTVLSGKTKMKARWKRVVEITSNKLGEAAGKFYVERYFPPEAKNKMLELVANLKSALRENISNLSWMTEETRKKAIEKLDSMKLKIGYPDKWRDYSSLKIKHQAFVLNVISANNFDFKYMISETDKPVDRNKWEMTPQTVNAYFSPTMNEIVFPAAILQPPFFTFGADDAVNYGAIGTVIGHEMTHGFDDQGRQYDKNGNLSDWWNAQDEQNFKQYASEIVKLYSEFKMLDSYYVNGELTLGENIADFGGISTSLSAFKKTLTGNEKAIAGFMPLQRFFLSYAQIWRQSIRDKELIRRLKEDVHSPARARVNIPVKHSADFYKAFNISEKSPSYIPEDKRARIW